MIPTLTFNDLAAWSSNNLSLNTTAASLYLNKKDSHSLNRTVSDVLSGVHSKLVCGVIDIDDGADLASFDAAHTQFTVTGVTSVTVYSNYTTKDKAD